MERSVFLDTHVVLWLHAGRVDIFPERVQDILKSTDLVISSFVELELSYLYEIERVEVEPKRIIAHLEKDLGLRRWDSPLSDLVQIASIHRWTRDPFDRLIVSQADLLELQLISKDKIIQKNYPRTFW